MKGYQSLGHTRWDSERIWPNVRNGREMAKGLIPRTAAVFDRRR